VLILILTQCIDIDGVDQPDTIQSGDMLTAIVHVHIKSAKDVVASRLVVGFLAPKKWNASANATLSYTSNFGNGSMSLVPPGSQPAGSTGMDWPTAIRNKAGIGKNKIRDLEWVVFWSDRSYDIANGDDIHADVTVKVKTGDQDVVVDLGYFAACSTEDINGSSNPYGVKFATLETTGGTGPVINFLVPQLSLIDPLQNLDNEYITLNFDGAIIPTALTGASQVFLCATAYTHDNQTITVCGSDDKEKMTNIGQDKWQIDMWPRQYFNVPDGQSIDSIKYYFTNAAGDATVKQPDSDLPFMYIFSCQ
jgi:hypothetical protein